jgi:hypothetical protein
VCVVVVVVVAAAGVIQLGVATSLLQSSAHYAGAYIAGRYAGTLMKCLFVVDEICGLQCDSALADALIFL